MPDPVGATTSASRPAVMASHASSWAGVAASKTSPNHARVAGEKRLNALDFCTSSILPGRTDSFRSVPPGRAVSPASGMIVAMLNRVRTALVIVAGLVCLTGCVKLDADLKVNSDETVSGTMQLGIDKQLMGASGQSLDKVREQVEKGIKETTTDGVTCKAFEDSSYVGSNCSFEAVPFSKMGNSTGDGVGFRKDGDKFIVTVKGMNLGNVPSGSQPVVNFKITMPGKILEHDAGAKVDGRTATYDSLDKLGNVSLTSEAGSAFPLWALILIIALVLIAAGAAVFFVLRSRKAAGQPQYGQYGQYPGQPQPGQWGQYGGQPGAPGPYGGPQQQAGQYPPPSQYPGQQAPYGQPYPSQYPGQPRSPQQGQPGPYGPPPQQGQPHQYGPQQGPAQHNPGGWGQQPPPQGPPQGQPPNRQPPQQGPQQGPPPQGPPQQGQPGQGQPGQGQGGWGQPPEQGGPQGG